MSSAAEAALRPPDSGVTALVILLRVYGVAIEPEQIAHQYGTVIGVSEMLRCAKDLKLKARVVESNWDRLQKTTLPVIAEQRNGGFLILAKVSADQILIHDPLVGKPQAVPRSGFEAQWTGRLILMARRSGIGELARRFDISWFLEAIQQYRRLMAEVIAASFFLQLFALITPLFFQVVIDKVLIHRGLSTLAVLAIGLAVVSIFESILAALRTYVFSHTANRIDVVLGARLFRHLLALPIAYFESRRTGDSVARVRELENIRNFITSSALTLVIDLFFAIVFLAVMVWYSPSLTLVVVASLPLYVVLSIIVTPLFHGRLAHKFDRGAENQALLVESISGIETLKALSVEPQMQRHWEERLAAYIHASFRVSNLANWSSQIAQLISKLTTVGILFFGAQAVINGSLTIGELVAFNMLAGRLTQPVLRLAQLWQDFHQTRISIDRLGDVLNTQPEPLFTPGRTALPSVSGAIAFEHVGFRYKVDGPEVLRDINLAIPAGQVVGIVGPSGSGKSTFAKLVQRLYVPESGRVLIDGADLNVVDVSWLRRQIGVVLQENVLFNRSVRDNIALTNPGMSIHEIIEAAKLAGAHEFILNLPQGYDSMVGERGTNLSGGQRQRLAIARALITNPRILILDEATSALDYESENVIRLNMRRIVQGRTVIIIAHRLSAVRNCDRIIAIDRGMIIEDGDHDQLLRAGGHYAALWRHQAGENAG